MQPGGDFATGADRRAAGRSNGVAAQQAEENQEQHRVPSLDGRGLRRAAPNSSSPPCLFAPLLGRVGGGSASCRTGVRGRAKGQYARVGSRNEESGARTALSART